jgi:hypothetical protein
VAVRFSVTVRQVREDGSEVPLDGELAAALAGPAEQFAGLAAWTADEAAYLDYGEREKVIGQEGRELQELAASRDAGFDLLVLADMLAVIDIYPDAEFSAYGLRAEKIQQMRERFAEWRTDLLRQPGPTGA